MMSQSPHGSLKSETSDFFCVKKKYIWFNHAVLQSGQSYLKIYISSDNKLEPAAVCSGTLAAQLNLS